MNINPFQTAIILNFNELIDYAAGGVVSKQVMKAEKGNVTLFAFDAGQGLSEHSAPFDALVQVTDGTAEITIGGKPFQLKSGDSIIMPANIAHALKATTAFKMILTMIRA
ncbi:MAG: cupin domain-containing protein [Bacteroidales bacterium]|nr:cupin domain-containing protein [Bacteroidales bacterium]